MTKRKRKNKGKLGQSFVDAIFVICVSAIVSFFFVMAASANYEILSSTQSSGSKNIPTVFAEKNDIKTVSEEIVKSAVREEKDLAYLSEVREFFQNFIATGSISIGLPNGDILINGVGFYDSGSVDVSYRGGANQYLARGVLNEKNNSEDLKDISIVLKNNLKY
ncbi:MAG: hypothetical protein WC415_06295 [Patescibacteria group bacterium]|jgi:hypothetical protein